MLMMSKVSRFACTTLAALTLAIAGPAAAQDITQFVTSPPHPIDSRPTELIVAGLYFCPVEPRVIEESVDGQNIRIGIEFAPGCVLAPPFAGGFAFTIDLGLLEPGNYSAHVDIHFLGSIEPSIDAAILPFTVGPSQAAVVLPEEPLFQGEQLTLQMAGVALCPPSVTAALSGSLITWTVERCNLGQPPLPYVIDLDPIGPLTESAYSFEVRDGVDGQLLQRGTFELLSKPALLRSERYAASVDWLDFDGQVGEGRSAIASSRDSALFYFFEPDNWELMLKLIDGCAINGHQWVLGAASTTVGYDITIEDRWSQQPDWTFSNDLGNPSPAFVDIEAFECE